MAEYLGPATTNEVEVVSTSTGGHRTPDRYATGHGNEDKFGYSHDHIIDGSLDRYKGETPEGWRPC